MKTFYLFIVYFLVLGSNLVFNETKCNYKELNQEGILFLNYRLLNKIEN